MTKLFAFFNSLRVRFVLSIAIIQLVMMALLLWSSVTTLRSTHENRLAEAARNLVQLFADTGGQYMVSVDYASLEQYAQRVLKDRELAYVAVLDPEQNRVATAGSIQGALPAVDAGIGAVTDGVYDVAADMMFGGKVRGTVRMGFSLERMLSILELEAVKWTLTAASGIFLSIVVALVVGHGLTRRLAVLVRGTEAVVHGQYDLELPVEGPEEVRRLTQGYNSMLRALDSRIHELQFSEERFRSLVDSSPDCVLMVDLDWRVVHMSSAGLNIFRVSRSDDVIGKPLAELFPPVSRDWLANALQRARDGDAMSATVEGYGAREDERWLEIILAPVRAIDGHIASIIGRLRDVTASKAQAAALEHMTLHDMLTDLPNRGLFLERLEHALGEAQRENKSLAVIVMDLDRFKEVNDTLGHHIGDQLLQQVALRLQDTFRGEMIARLGGDEFAVYVPGATESAAIQYGQRAIKALEQPIPLSDLDIQIGTSIGITMFPPHGRTGAVLLQRADVAMYYAKRQKTGFAVYTQQIDPNSLRRLALVGELRHAIDNDELILHFQPKVDGTGRNCCGVEALVRWQHPQHGMMPPMEFIGLAEETGLIRPLTRWVLDAALRQWDKWQALGHRLPIAVNLSVRNLLDPKLAELIASQLRRWNVPPQFLQLEITESDIMSDPERALKVLRSLDQMGISLAIDDFGTGYSSLAYLKRLPVDEIKIDKSFVMNMAHDDNDALIVEATIDLAHKLGLSIVAEGVEDAATMARLHSAGCNALQGFLISRPVPADALVAWLASHTIGSAEVAR